MDMTPQNGGRRLIGPFLALALVFGAGLYIGTHQLLTQAQQVQVTSPTSTTITLTPLSDGGQPQNVDFSQFWRTWNLLQQNFVEAHASGTAPTDQDKLYGAIQGLVDSYGDPYTEFFPPKDAQVFDQNISGSFGGIGVEIDSLNGVLVVIAPLKGSPAEAAGLKPNDAITAIDGSSTADMTVDDAVQLIRGQKGTPVKLTISRAGVTQPFVVSVVRDTIQIPTIDTKSLPGGIFEIDLYNFSGNATNDFRQALREFLQSGDTKLLLDMRGNPGGYLDSAVDIASYFLPAGDSIVTEDYRGSRDNITHRSYGYNIFSGRNLSMAILTDQGTASAAEILSGALQQHGVAKLVGTRTFGKGSVQELMDLGGGAELKVTIARWLTPNGTSISDGGLKPDIQATTTQKDIDNGKDPQKDAAIEYLTTH